MKIVFVTVGTSLLQKPHLGMGKLFGSLKASRAVNEWAANRKSLTKNPEKIWDLLDRLAGEANAPGSSEALDNPASQREEWIAVLCRAFAAEGGLQESDFGALPAELASLAALLPEYPLGSGDRVVLLASDSPQGALIGLLLKEVLAGHARLGGAGVDVVWPEFWQPNDGETLFRGGAIHMLRAVDGYLGQFAAARALFILTGGLKLSIAVLVQVSCWSGRLDQQDGLLLKLEDPGTLYFPPCRFLQRGREEVLLPRAPVSVQLRGFAPFTESLGRLIENSRKPSRALLRPRCTSLLVTAGLGILDKKKLGHYFGESSRLSNSNVWQPAHYHWKLSWAELRAIDRDSPREDELREAEPAIQKRLEKNWKVGDTQDLPGELASLRSLWSGEPLRPCLEGPLRIVLLATDTLLGKTCAGIVARFLQKLLSGIEVEKKEVPGLHPYRSLYKGEDRFSSLAQIAVDEGSKKAHRLLFLPLGGSKVHLPIMTVLASRLRAPMLLGHQDLGALALVPWIESENGNLRTAELDRDWPEFASMPKLRLEE